MLNECNLFTFNVLVGAQPVPSIECSRNKLYLEKEEIHSHLQYLHVYWAFVAAYHSMLFLSMYCSFLEYPSLNAFKLQDHCL